MAISETTALARARQVRATFPTGPITITQAKAMVLAMADSQVGYASGSATFSTYGKQSSWPAETWSWNAGQSQGYWCARGISWVFTMCFGRAATIAGIGNQGFPFPGWAATWLWRDWFRGRGLHVGLENAQPGDISLQRWGRTTNPTDHVELVTGRWNGASYPLIGFNTIAGSGPVTTGATVAAVRRTRTALVGVYRPDWAALVAAYNATMAGEDLIDWTTVHRLLLDLGYTADVPGVRAFQKDHGLTVDGIPGPKTTATLEAVMSAVLNELKAIRAELQDHRARLSKLHERQTNLGQSNNNVNRNLSDLIAKVPAAVWGYRNPGYPARDSHGLARDGATAKQGLRELAAALRSTGAINAAGEATVQAATDSDTQED